LGALSHCIWTLDHRIEISLVSSSPDTVFQMERQNYLCSSAYLARYDQNREEHLSLDLVSASGTPELSSDLLCDSTRDCSSKYLFFPPVYFTQTNSEGPDPSESNPEFLFSTDFQANMSPLHLKKLEASGNICPDDFTDYLDARLLELLKTQQRRCDISKSMASLSGTHGRMTSHLPSDKSNIIDTSMDYASDSIIPARTSKVGRSIDHSPGNSATRTQEGLEPGTRSDSAESSSSATTTTDVYSATSPSALLSQSSGTSVSSSPHHSHNWKILHQSPPLQHHHHSQISPYFNGYIQPSSTKFRGNTNINSTLKRKRISVSKSFETASAKRTRTAHHHAPMRYILFTWLTISEAHACVALMHSNHPSYTPRFDPSAWPYGRKRLRSSDDEMNDPPLDTNSFAEPPLESTGIRSAKKSRITRSLMAPYVVGTYIAKEPASLRRAMSLRSEAESFNNHEHVCLASFTLFNANCIHFFFPT
jgi:hypothetical protein